MTERWYVGIDIGGTNLVVGLVPEEGGPPQGLRVRATDPARGADAIVTDVVRMARESIREDPVPPAPCWAWGWDPPVP